jgi:hypothetical protein
MPFLCPHPLPIYDGPRWLRYPTQLVVQLVVVAPAGLLRDSEGRL